MARRATTEELIEPDQALVEYRRAEEPDFRRGGNSAIDRACDEYLARLDATRVKEAGIASGTLRAILRAMCLRMRLVGSEVFAISVRELAVDANISATTAQSALTRLRAAGCDSWAVWCGRDDEHHTGLWRLNYERLAAADGDADCPHGSICEGRSRGIAAAATGSSRHDSWSHKSLGKSAQAVLNCLLQSDAQTTAEVAKKLGVAHNTAKSALARLSEARLVAAHGKRWTVTEEAGLHDLDTAAHRAGTAGKTKRKQESIERERLLWERWKKGDRVREPSAPAESLRFNLPVS